MELKRVVVTGLGAVTPLGNDVETTWQNAVAGVSGAGPITHFDASLFKTQFACEVKNFNGADFFDRKRLRTLDLYSQYALVAAQQAVEDSKINAEGIDADAAIISSSILSHNPSGSAAVDTVGFLSCVRKAAVDLSDGIFIDSQELLDKRIRDLQVSGKDIIVSGDKEEIRRFLQL